MAASDLKPCPFCGHKVHIEIGYMGINFFKCDRCGAVVSFNTKYYNAHKERAKEAWNRRAENA